MELLKCKSCGGTLEKDGNIYICQRCGEAFKNNQNTTKTVNINNNINNDNIPDYQLCDVVLKELPNKLSAIKVVRELTGWDLKQAKNCIDEADINLPYTYKSAIPKAEALRIAKMFSDSRNSAEVIPNA